MASGQRRHLSHRLALTTCCCKRPFVARCVRRVSYPWEYSPSPAGDRPLWRPPSGHFFPSLHLNYPSQSGYIRVVVPFWFPSNSVFFPGSPSYSNPSAPGSPFISPGPGARRTHLPPPDAPEVAQRAWTKSRSFAMPHIHLCWASKLVVGFQ